MNKHVSPQTQSPRLRHRHRRRRRRPCARPRHSLRRTDRGPRRRRLARGQRLGGDPARRHRRDPHRALGNGPGHPHRPRPARRRRTRMRLVEGHDRISRRPARASPASAPGAISRPAAAAASAPRRIMSARAAPPRAMMLIQAAANEWKVPASECTAANSVITHKPSGKTTTYGKVAEAAAKLTPPADVKLKDPKDWKIAGKGVKRLDTPDKVTGTTDLRHRRQAAGHAQRRDQGLPGHRRQAEELRRSQDRRDEGRQEGGEGRATPRSPSSPTPGGTPRPRSMRCRSSGTKARTPRSPAPRSRNGCRKASMAARPMSAIRTAT